MTHGVNWEQLGLCVDKIYIARLMHGIMWVKGAGLDLLFIDLPNALNYLDEWCYTNVSHNYYLIMTTCLLWT